jgi:PLP dependent protein
MGTIAENLAGIRQVLQKESAGRVQPPRLIAVTKTIPAGDILPLRELGITDIAENRVQELLTKYPLLQAKFDLHMIGRLQTNKVKYIIDKVSMIQSVDRMDLAYEINRRAQQNTRVMPVLIEVNITGEAEKAGVSPMDLPGLLRRCARLPGLSVQGLMTMMPLGAERIQLAEWFAQARRLFDAMAGAGIANIAMRELSMGMSQDYDLAAQAGATMVRIGTALFKK